MAALVAAGLRMGYGTVSANSKKTRAFGLIIKTFEVFSEAESQRE